MATDVFSRTIDYGGSFSADGVRLAFDEFNGLIVQSLNVNYQQQISRIYDIGTNVYLVGGRTQGTLGLAQLVGPKKLQPAFYQKFGDVCQAGQNNMDFKFESGCNQAGDIGSTDTMRVNHAVIASLAGSVNANDVMFNEQLSFMFLFLQRF